MGKGGYMRAFKVFALLVPVVLTISLAYAGKPKTGEYKAGILADGKLNYTLHVADNWRVRTFDEPSVMRALLIKKNYEVNRMVKDLGGDFTIPEIHIYARPDTTAPKAFLARLQEEVQSHNSNDNIISKLDLLLSGEFIMMQETMIDSIPTVQALFKKNFTRRLEMDPNDARYRQFGGMLAQNEHEVREIYIFSRDGWLFLIQAFAEREFYPVNQGEFQKIIGSLKFAKTAPTSPGDQY